MINTQHSLAGQEGKKIFVEQQEKGQPLLDTISCLTL